MDSSAQVLLPPSKKIKLDNDLEMESIQFQTPVESIVFGELLPEILNYIPTKALVNYRRVNQTWRQTAEKILSKRSDHFISLRFNVPLNTYVLKGFEGQTLKATSPNPPLSQLNKLIRSWVTPSSSTSILGRNVLCTNFFFIGGNLACPAAQEFFLLMGSSIKSLTLEFWDYVDHRPNSLTHVTDLDTFSDLLSTKLTTDFSLTIRSFPSSWWNIQQLPPTFLAKGIPKLKQLDISMVASVRTPIIEKLLAASTNLESIHFKHLDIPSTTMDNVVGYVTSHQHRIATSNLTIKFLPDQHQVDLIGKFADYNVQLTNLHFALSYRKPIQDPSRILSCEGRDRSENFYLKIFTNSKNSLQTVKFGPTTFALLNKFASRGRLPGFEQVHSLVLDGHHDHFDPQPHVTSWWFKMSNLFPNLHEVRIDLRSLDDHWPITSYCPPFQESDQMEKVKKVTINCNSRNKNFPKNMYLTFPNAESLTLLSVKCFHRIAQHIWKFTNLITLSFNLNLNTSKFPHLDAAFTGFSQQNVSEISSGDLKNKEDFEKLRVSPSIVHLKDLKLMEVFFQDWEPKSKTSYNFLTHVTGLYGFKLLPELQVIFCLNDYAIQNTDNLRVLTKSLLPLTLLSNVHINIKEDRAAAHLKALSRC